MPRLLVGAWPPPDVVDALAAYPRPPVAGLRWSTPSQWLVTMRPLGAVDDVVVAQLLDVLRAELDGAGPTAARFGPVTRKGWLQAPVDGLDALTAVVLEVTEELVPVTHPQPLRPAVVLARGPKVPPEIVGRLDASWTVEALTLARATTTAAGPGYAEVGAIPLGRPTSRGRPAAPR